MRLVFIEVSNGVTWKNNASDNLELGAIGFVLENSAAHKIQGSDIDIFSESSEEIDIEGGGNFQNMGSLTITLHNLTDLAAYLQRWNLINNEVEIFAGNADSGTLYFEEDCITVFRGFIDDAIQHDYTTLTLNLIDYASQLDVMFPERFINKVDFPFADSDVIDKPYQILIGNWLGDFDTNKLYNKLLGVPVYQLDPTEYKFLCSNNYSSSGEKFVTQMSAGHSGEMALVAYGAEDNPYKITAINDKMVYKFIYRPQFDFYILPRFFTQPSSSTPILDYADATNCIDTDPTNSVSLVATDRDKCVNLWSDDCEDIGDWMVLPSPYAVTTDLVLVVILGINNIPGGINGGKIEVFADGTVPPIWNTYLTDADLNATVECEINTAFGNWRDLHKLKYRITSFYTYTVSVEHVYLRIRSQIRDLKDLFPDLTVKSDTKFKREIGSGRDRNLR
jgi:hypothetical protein